MKNRTKASVKKAQNDDSEWKIQVYDSSLEMDPPEKWYVRLTEEERPEDGKKFSNRTNPAFQSRDPKFKNWTGA